MSKQRDPEASIWTQDGGKWVVEKALQLGIHSLYRSPNIVKMFKNIFKWAGLIVRMEDCRNHLVRPRHRWEDMLEYRIDIVNWINSAQDRDCWR